MCRQVFNGKLADEKDFIPTIVSFLVFLCSSVRRLFATLRDDHIFPVTL